MNVMSSIIKISIGSTYLLGFKKSINDYPITTVYLLTPGKCLKDCKYCSLAKSSKSEEKFLSRVVWPTYDLDETINRIKENKDKFKRVCIQTVNNRFSKDIVDRIVKELKDITKISISINTESEERIKNLFDIGAERVGIPLDITSEKSYGELRGGDFFKKINFILKMGKIFENKISTHIIVGLNDTDYEIMNIYKLFVLNRINVGLFAFTPIKGTSLEKKDPPKLFRYRKIQLATKLIEIGFNLKDFKFTNKGEVAFFPKFDLDEIIKTKPFNTRGCPDCNRPFYNEKPKGEIYNYPYDVSFENVKREILDLGLDKLFI